MGNQEILLEEETKRTGIIQCELKEFGDAVNTEEEAIRHQIIENKYLEFVNIVRHKIFQEEFQLRAFLYSHHLLDLKKAFVRMALAKSHMLVMIPDIQNSYSTYQRSRTLKASNEEEIKRGGAKNLKLVSKHHLEENDNEDSPLLRQTTIVQIGSLQVLPHGHSDYEMFKRMFWFGFFATCCDLTGNIFKLHNGNEYAKGIVTSVTWLSHITRDISTLYGVFYATEQKGFRDIFMNFKKYFWETRDRDARILVASIILTGFSILSDIFYLSSLYDPAGTSNADVQFHSNSVREGLLYTATVLNFLSNAFCLYNGIHIHLNHEAVEVA